MPYKHLPPNYYGYCHGTFTNVNGCTNLDCSLLGLYEDLSQTQACPECGGKIEQLSIAAKWVPPIYESWWKVLFGAKRKITEGYWQFSEIKK